MKHIFAWLAIASNAGLIITFFLGWNIEDPASLAKGTRDLVSQHFLTAVVAVTMALLVHAIVLTYFMGTGRWIEETSAAYRFDPTARQRNIRLKYRVIPGMVLSLLLLITTGAFGAIADPASNMKMPSATMIHFTLAIVTLIVNMGVSWLEYEQIVQNGKLVEQVYQEVLAVRKEHGLD